MTTPLDLKAIERKAYRSTYQDGLWDIYTGLVLVSMSIFVYRPAEGYSPVNILLALLLISTAFGLFRLGKQHITLPRMGQVQFGPSRKQKKTTLAIWLGGIVLLQVVLVVLTALGQMPWQAIGSLDRLFASLDPELLGVALIGALIVGVSMTLIAYFSDFPRGYYIAAMMSLAVFLMIYLNQPLYPILLGAIVILPGVVLLVRFLNTYKLPEEAPHE